ncbi:LacI family DNA-binding transcriptional regulator [Gracilinema caldarium]|uniref:Transcriptional regulator, LacI family n=1 Tax=Gracilinema caldarium (strain ATCC 51460 / DSM 7334 / H1) TaxID=744872 RepID=F8EZK0_GRAC1|nr:LacI family DNA-binding transcriptional regulator [Gracilinema caldarium]AEJ20724.1 transcriptional regulator, LacI family [Gracilinema caldarium DSM 7334]
MPTIEDVARHAGVSTRTVSRVLNDRPNVRSEVRERVLAAVEQLGYRPDPNARALKSGRKQIIGIVANAVSSDTTLRRIEIISKLFAHSGYAVLMQFAESSEMEEAAINAITPRCDGLVIFSNLHSSHSPALLMLHNHRIPFIVVDPPVDIAFPSIYIDRRSGYREAVRYLVQRGRQELLLVVESFRSSERIAGFLEGLERENRPFRSNRILHTGKGFQGGVDVAPLVLRVLQEEQIDGILCHNDKIALGLLGALQKEHIQIPEALALIGFDDDNFSAYINPPLTTIAQTGGDVGAYIYEQLKNAIEYGTAIESRTFGTGLVLRASA